MLNTDPEDEEKIIIPNTEIQSEGIDPPDPDLGLITEDKKD